MQRLLRRMAAFGPGWSFAAQDVMAGGAPAALKNPAAQARLVVFEGIYSCD